MPYYLGDLKPDPNLKNYPNTLPNAAGASRALAMYRSTALLGSMSPGSFLLLDELFPSRILDEL